MDRRGSLRDFFGTALLRKHVLSLFRANLRGVTNALLPIQSLAAQICVLKTSSDSKSWQTASKVIISDHLGPDHSHLNQ